MGLFDRWKAKKRIKMAREEAKKNPTPKTTAKLADVLLEYKEFDNALAVLDMGTKVFPDSDILEAKYKQVKKLKFQDQIRDMRKKISQSPEPIAFAQLADIYIKIGEEDKAIEVGQEGTEKFPEYEGNHLILGKLRWDRYRKYLVSKDGVKAVEHFEQAASLNPNNYKVLFQLAKIYVEIGAAKKAKEKINTILQYFPNDENALKLKRRADLLPESEYHEDLDDLFKAFKSKNPNLKKTSATMGSNISQRLLKDSNFAQGKLETLKNLPGLLGLLICDDDNKIAISYYQESSWKGQIEDVVQRTVKAAKDCSLRMDIGSFQDSRIEGPDGWIYMKSFVQIVFVMFFSPKTKYRQVEQKLSDFFEFGIYQ